MKGRLIVFVHGLGGAAASTWRRAGRAGFPELIARDKAVQQEADVAFFEYPTSLFRLPFSGQAPGIRDLAEGLRSELEVRYPEYKSIALVCHSLGGLVARKYLVEEVKRASRLRVDKLLLYAVPHQGAGLAKAGQQISWRHNQLRQLCRDSDFLDDLNSDWKALAMRSKLQVSFVVGGQDGVVTKESAVEQWGEAGVQVILKADHRSLVKPEAASDLSYMIFRRFVLGPAPVFLSVGGSRTKQQDAFVASVKKLCLSRGLDASTVDEYTATNKQPLKDVAHRMSRCYGAIVLAFERARVESGVWRRGCPGEEPMKDVRFPTVWNQIEAAMAYVRGLPLLVVAEAGLQSEGLLESKYDWRVKWVDLDTFAVEDPEFSGMFDDWRESVLQQRDGTPGAGAPAGAGS